MEKKNNKPILLAVIGIVVLIIAVIGVSYAMFQANLLGTKENTISVGSITLNYIESGTAITLEDGEGFGLTDAQGEAQTEYFEFTVSATASGTVALGYYIYFEELATTLPASAIKLYLTTYANSEETAVATTKMNNSGTNPALANTFTNVTVTDSAIAYAASGNYRVLAFDSFSFTDGAATPSSRTYRLRMWVDSSYVESIAYAGTCSDGTSTTPLACTTAGGTWTDTTTDTHSVGTTSKTYSLKINIFGADSSATKITAS